MNESIIIVLSVTLYKVVTLLIGLAFAYMGYRLFMAGVWGSAGDVDTQMKDLKLVMRKAAPGTFFVTFGTIIVCSTVFWGLEFTSDSLPQTKFNIAEIPERIVELPEALPDIEE